MGALDEYLQILPEVNVATMHYPISGFYDLDCCQPLDAFGVWFREYVSREVSERYPGVELSGLRQVVKRLWQSSGQLLDIAQFSRACELDEAVFMSCLEVAIATDLFFSIPAYHRIGHLEVRDRSRLYVRNRISDGRVQPWIDRNTDLAAAVDPQTIWTQTIANRLTATVEKHQLYHWCDRRRRKIDFVIAAADRTHCTTIECIPDTTQYSSRCLKVFRRLYPRGQNFIFTPQVSIPNYTRFDNLGVIFCTPEQWQSGQVETIVAQVS